MTTADALAALADIVADLSREMPRETRLERLLGALMRGFPCDAAALLQLDGDSLVPRAIRGLDPETMSRRFPVADEPRLREILHANTTVRFAPDSRLHDPYDGLVDTPGGHIYVHDCMGAPLHVDGKAWGVLTLDALERGAFDSFDLRVFETFVAVAAATIRASEVIGTLENEVLRHQQVQQSWLEESEADALLGDSPPVQQLRREALVVGRADVAVLIQGETGVGKELVARLVHRQSPRASRPMVQVNCAALPESMAESELFGHVAGAFSGALRERAGKFELANGGTLLLDEIGELPLSLQPKLLRVLQSGELQRVGSDRTHRVDVRIIAATNRDLPAEMRRGRFRADLYHRLNVYPLDVPPLRERGDDVLLLAGAFMQRCERRLGLRGVRLARATREWMRGYRWPGNVRELEHAITRAVVRALGDGLARERIIELTPRHLGAEPDDGPGAGTTLAVDLAATEPEPTLAAATEQFRRELVRRRLARHQDNLAAAARSLGMDRGNFHRLLKRLGLR